MSTGNKYKFWSLALEKSILILGDSNLSHLPRYGNRDIEVHRFPGANLSHACHVLKNKMPIFPKAQHVILSFGFNNRAQGDQEVLEQLVQKAET